MDNVPFAECGERGLHDANVSLHPAEQHGRTLPRQPPKHRAEYVAAEAGEHCLVDGSCVREQGSDLQGCIAETLGILRTDDCRNLQDSSETDQQSRISQQPFAFPNRRQKLFLDVDNDERALLGLKRPSRNPCVVGVELDGSEW